MGCILSDRGIIALFVLGFMAGMVENRARKQPVRNVHGANREEVSFRPCTNCGLCLTDFQTSPSEANLVSHCPINWHCFGILIVGLGLNEYAIANLFEQ